ncbi:MAG: WG repeat-containing protein [Bacteroidia bacterium]
MKIILPVVMSLFVLACSNGQGSKQYEDQSEKITHATPKDTLFKVYKDDSESEEEFGYANQKGEMVVPFGKFSYSFADTIIHYGTVMEDFKMIAINSKGQQLYEVYLFDNGPDYIEDGLFRIQENGKIGYADGETGEVVIKPQFACALPFANGQAQVANECTLEGDGEHPDMKSDGWFFIDKKGEKIK